MAIESLEGRRLLTAWYVATTGIASNNGTLAHPFATIQQAANVAEPGDTVNIFGGTYRETVVPATAAPKGRRLSISHTKVSL